MEDPDYYKRKCEKLQEELDKATVELADYKKYFIEAKEALSGLGEFFRNARK